MTAQNPKRIGKYEIIDLLGRGGMGMVYRAFDPQLSREVAIKTVTEGFSGDEEMLKRFYREAAKTAALRHPNIVIVYDLGEEAGFPYIVMEYLSGDPLDHIIQSGQPQPLAFKLKIIEQVCYALGYAHRNDMIHRDVKPANVIVQTDGVAKLLDFGIARQDKTDGRLTRTGSVIGTIQYMAPERLKDEAFDGRSDIFSVGVMMFQLLTGQLPFTGDYSIVPKIIAERHPPLSQYLRDYPPALDQILDRALAKNPAERFATADEMAAEIALVADQLKQEQVAEWIQRAERLVEGEDYSTARDVLLRVLKIDTQHTRARQLIAQVQQNLAVRQRAEQILDLRMQAEQAAADKRYEEALLDLQEACRLDPENPELAQLLDTIHQKKRIRDLVDGHLGQAEAARGRGDFDSAGAHIAQALELDDEDTRIRAAQVSLSRAIEDATRQAKAAELLESARKEIGARRFTAAMEVLTQVEALDPSNPELIKLHVAAKSGREQEQRRRILEQVQSQVSLASTPEEVAQAVQLVDQALERMPTETTLIKLKAQLWEVEMRRRVDQIALQCRTLMETSPEEALRLVEQELQQAPGNERLRTLQSSVCAHVSELRLAQSRAEYLTRAHEAITNGRCIEALRLLQSAEKQGITSPELSELLERMRQETDYRLLKDAHLQELLSQAQELIKKEFYEAAVKLLSPVASEPGAASLLLLLDEARERLQSIQHDVDLSLRMAEALTTQEHYGEGIKFLESQPSAVLHTEAVQTALKRLHDSSDSELMALEAVGKAYAALDHPESSIGLPNSMAATQSTLLKRIVPVYTSRRKSVADRQLSTVLERARAAIAAGNKKQAVRALESAAGFAEHASNQLQVEWQALCREAERGRRLAG